MGYWDRKSKGKSGLSDKIVKPKKSSTGGRSWFDTSEKKIDALAPKRKRRSRKAKDESLAATLAASEREGIALNDEIHEPLTENSDSAVENAADTTSGFAPLPDLEIAGDAGSDKDTSNVIDFDRRRSERLAETLEPTSPDGSSLSGGPSSGSGRSYLRSGTSNAVERAEVETAYQSILAAIAPESHTMTDIALKQDHLDDEFVDGEIDIDEDENIAVDTDNARRTDDEDQDNKPRLVTLVPAPDADRFIAPEADAPFEFEENRRTPALREEQPRQTDPALGYYHTYRADTDETQDDDDSRKAAYYLAGAASLTAICAAVYLLLPNNRTSEGVVAPAPQPDEGNETASDTSAAIPAISLDAPASSGATATTTVDTAPETVVETPAVTAPIAMAPVTSTEGDLSVDLNTGELFAGAETATETPTETLSTPTQTITADATPPVVSVTAADPDVVMAPDAIATSNVNVAAPRIKPKPDVSFGANIANPQLVTPQLHTLPSMTSNAPIEPGTVSEAALSQIPDSHYFTPDQRQSFATTVRASFDKAQAGEVNQITAANGASVFLTVGDRSQRLHTTPVKLSSTMAPLPNAVTLSPDWLVTRTSADLRNIPNVEADAVTAVIPAGAPIQQMGHYAAPNGDNWRLIGQEDVAVGWLHASEVMPASLAQTITQAPFETPVAASSTQEVLTNTDCRDFKMGSLESVACRLANGQWKLPDAVTNTLQAASLTTQPAPFESATPFQGRTLSHQHQTAIAGLVLNPSSKRRDARYGRNDSQDALNILFNGALTGETLTLSTTDGREGVISMAERAMLDRQINLTRAADVDPLSDGLTLDSGWVRIERQARLLDQPGGNVAQGVPSMMRGTPMQKLAVTQSKQGEDWALIGRNSVGFGFVRTDNVSDAVDFTPGNAGLTHILPTSLETDSVIVQTPCQTATYALGGNTGAIRACLNANGDWSASLEPTADYTGVAIH